MGKKNIPYILTYIAAVLVILLGALFYRQPVLTALLLLMILLPVLSIVLCYVGKNRLEVTFDTLPIAIEAGPESGFKVVMNVENKGPVPLLNCLITFKYSNRFYPGDKPNEMVFAAPPKSRKNYDLCFETSVPGLFEFETYVIRVTDLLHLKTWEKPFSKKLKTAILPAETSTDGIVLSKAPLEEEAESSLTGELTREIKQVREYEPGDKLRDMHWKQTARLDTPMVREFERMRESFYVLFPVLDTADQSVLGSTVALWYSLAKRLIEQGETVYTIIPDADGRSYEKIKSAYQDELIRTVYELYCSTAGSGTDTEGIVRKVNEEIPDAVLIRNGRIG